MRSKYQVQACCFDRCLSPVRKVSETMNFAEMCVTGFEQELWHVKNFLLSFQLMRYNGNKLYLEMISLQIAEVEVTRLHEILHDQKQPSLKFNYPYH